jgi:hypothetical protein
MVKRAAELATDKLQFFTSIDAAADWLGPVDVMHSNGALQGAQTMVWDRVYLGERETEIQVSHLANNGPGRAPTKTAHKAVRYVRTKIPEAVFLACHANYALIERRGDRFNFRRAAAATSAPQAG